MHEIAQRKMKMVMKVSYSWTNITKILSVFLISALWIPRSVSAEDLVIVAPDGEYLGRVGTDGYLCGEYESDCVWNKFSLYGSEFSATSIFSDFSFYGSSVGPYSVCNRLLQYSDIPVLVLATRRSMDFYDIIGPDAETEIGQLLYFLACIR